MRQPDNFSNNMITGLFLFQFMYRIQLQTFCGDEFQQGEGPFEYATSPELTEYDHKRLNNAVVATLDVAYAHFGMLQITRLTKGLFNPKVLQAISREVVVMKDEIDWARIADDLGKLRELYNLDALFNPFLDRPFGHFRGIDIRDQIVQMPALLDSVASWFYQSTDADYTYAAVWADQWADPVSMRVALRDVGVHPRDDSETTTAVGNLMGDDNGLFEAFCVYYSLGQHYAMRWEEAQVIYGNGNYKGAVTRAMRINTSTARDIMFAGALTAGYPVHDTEKPNEDFGDLIMRIPGFIHYHERGNVINLIHVLAPVLYLDLTQDHIHKPQMWRGIRLSVSWDGVQRQLEDYGDESLFPVAKLCSVRYANKGVAKWNDGNHFGEGDDELMDKMDRAREIAERSTMLRPSSNRVIWLADQLCEILEDEFRRQGYFN